MSRRRRSLRTRFRERRYTPTTLRIGLACAVGAAVCIVEFGSNSGADTSSFVPGNATAQAQAITVAPTTGGLNYAISLGISISDYQDMEAQSLSQTIDLGAIGTALEATGCNGGPPELNSKDVPASVQAESVNGNQNLSDSITPATSPVGAGNESAVVTTQPSATSLTEVSDITVPGGLLTISGLASSSHTSIDNGATRTSTATSSIGSISLAHGAVQIGNLTWTATQQSGATTTASGTFSVGSLTVAGVKVDTSKLVNSSTFNPQTVLTIINTALAPVGLNVQWPTMSTLPAGTVQISPLSVGIDNNTLGQEVIGTNLGATQTVRSAIVNALLGLNCNFATGILVGDIGIGVLAGGGNLNIQLGGATAVTNDLAEQSPFGSGSLPNGPSPSVSTASGNSGNTGTGPVGALTTGSTGTGSLSTPGTPSTPATAGVGTGSGVKESLGPITKSTACVSLGPSGGGCSGTNAAVPIGLVSLGLVVALFVWDYLRQRRRDRLTGAVEGMK
ncbi:MAG TPA: hypothetical protein VK773_05200 [Acidimicrobiales bacterium]|nr:hypothetical protein [Acidimicrobiales bacterium]